jgi:hypothetical protein
MDMGKCSADQLILQGNLHHRSGHRLMSQQDGHGMDCYPEKSRFDI